MTQSGGYLVHPAKATPAGFHFFDLPTGPVSYTQAKAIVDRYSPGAQLFLMVTPRG